MYAMQPKIAQKRFEKLGFPKRRYLFTLLDMVRILEACLKKYKNGVYVLFFYFYKTLLKANWLNGTKQPISYFDVR